MKINVYVIDFETPRWLRKALAYGVPAIVVLGIAAVVIAAPQQWTSGQTLQASQLNNLAVVTNGSVGYSVGATKYCGTGPTNTTGAISYNGTGYVGAKAMCQASSGCGSSATAHTCSADEVLRSAQLGLVVPTGWYSSAVLAQFNSNTLDDCAGWSTAISTLWGTQWQTAAPNLNSCNALEAVLCCD